MNLLLIVAQTNYTGHNKEFYLQFTKAINLRAILRTKCDTGISSLESSSHFNKFRLEIYV